MKLSYYGNKISPNMVKTNEGFLVCMNVPIARIGQMEYSYSDLNIRDAPPNEIVVVYRLEEDVFNLAAIASFEGKPVTNNHPPEDVEAGNYNAYSKGHAQNVRRGQGEWADYLIADLLIHDPLLIDEVENGKREISCGYHMDIEQLPDGRYVQRNIRGNHISIVTEGRAGPNVSIKDTKNKNIFRRKKLMKAKDAKRKSIFSLLARGVRDAKTEEEVEAVIDDAMEAIRDEDAEPAIDPVVEAVERLVEKVTGDSEETAPEEPVMDSDESGILAAINGLSEKIDGLIQLQSKGIVEDEDPIEELIEELSEAVGDEGDDGGSNGEFDPASEEESVSVPAEAMDEDEGSEEYSEGGESVADSKIKLLKILKPSIANIKDTAERKRITDALVKALRTKKATKDGYTNILRTTTKRARDSVYCGEVSIKKQQLRYDKLNPHTRKKGE